MEKRLKTMQDFTPTSIENVAGSFLRIRWLDGHQSAYPFAVLRRHCPCASCVDEISGRELLDPESIPGDLLALGARVVGNYAVGIAFADGHASGIYPFRLLRALCPCAICQERGAVPIQRQERP
ncbi:MAG: DUF971 domain-containing protein [Elusimicrobiota bacterium]